MSQNKRAGVLLMVFVILTGFAVWTQAQEPRFEGSVSTDVIRAYEFAVNLFGTLESEGIEEYISEDWVLHDPAGSGYSGTEGFITWATGFHVIMPDFELEHLEPRIGAGDYITYRWEFTGTHTGEVPDIAPTGNEVYMTGIIMHRMVDGQFAETWVSYDNLALLTQLGVLPGVEE